MHGPEPDNRWEAFAARGPRGGRAAAGDAGSSRWARCRWRCRTPGRSRSPRTPTAPSSCRAPARGAASCGSRAARSRCSRSGWGSGATTMLGFVAHIPHYLAQLDYPQGLGRAARAGRARRAADHRPHRPAQAWPRSARRRSPATSPPTRRSARWSPRSSGSTTRSSGPRSPGRACSPTTSRCRPATRSAGQFEQFLAGLDGPDADPGRAGLMAEGPTRTSRTSSRCSTSRTSTSTSTAAASRTRRAPGSTAARWPRRRWWPPSAAWTRSSTCTRSTPTSCCPATTRCRSSTRSSGSGTAARSSPGG